MRIGKLLVDFLLVVIELFLAIDVTTETLGENIDSKSACLKGGSI